MPQPPLATYRLQLHAGFGFDAASAVADYLQRLGVSHAYTSPYLQAAPDSMHGYDVVDHHKVNEELGGGEAHDRFCKQLGELGLGQVLDIVPNHMAISGRRNRWWWDVLENGPASRYASYFDLDWDSGEANLRNKQLMPVLGDHYGRALKRGEVTIERSGGEFVIKYFDNVFPVAPRSLAPILQVAATESGSDYLAFLADSLCRLPGPTSTETDSVIERHRDKEVVRRLLERLCEEVPFIAETIDHTVAAWNRDTDKLDQLLEQQNYRLAFWRTAEQELGYRRFFDVNTLVGLRMESEHVFADTHALILTWLREGVLDGVRVDHPDGLRDPEQYFERLRAAAPDVWILGEKILEPGETLRSSWPIDGTTGYDFLNQAAGLLVDSADEAELSRIYIQFTGESVDYEAICRDKKHQVMRELLGSDVNRMASLLIQICASNRDRRDFTRHDIARAIREVVACFSVYRTYIVTDSDEITDVDRKYISEAVTKAKENRPELDPELFDFIHEVLFLKLRGTVESEFVMRFQQFTAPVMAKGVEDTVFYSFNRLVSLNEVGGDPGRFGVPLSEFHQYCAAIQKEHPRSMLSSSTHDTKRSEDVRARISLLSEIPQRWEKTLYKWSRLNDKYRTDEYPDHNTEYLLYQTMLGAWPIEIDRIKAYMEKATKEAKANTSWITPNEQFGQALTDFIDGIYADRAFTKDLEEFVNFLLNPGRINSLSLQLLKLTAPGVPDIYQGTELWDLSLVDPDNRRPVDYQVRRQLLDELPHLGVEAVMARMGEGLPKLWLTYHALRIRRDRQSSFGRDGRYSALTATGSKAQHVVAFGRGPDIVMVAPRLIMKLGNSWGNTTLSIPDGVWQNVLAGDSIQGGRIKLAELLDSFPVALLVRQ